MIKGKLNLHKLKGLIASVSVLEMSLFQVKCRVDDMNKAVKKAKRMLTKLAKLNCEK